MNKFEPSRLLLRFSLAISAFGFFTVLMLALHGAPSAETVTWRKSVIGSIFALICFIGIVGALSPRKCSETFGHQSEVDTVYSQQTSDSGLHTKGHHYDCGKFSAHTIRVNGHTLCTACTGLFLGGIGALLGTILYFFAGWKLDQTGFLTVAIGVTAMTLGFLQLKFSGFARLTLNVLFVLGAFLILTGIDGLIKSLWIDLFTIVLIAFWIFTRILLSQWDHWRICGKCSVSCAIRGQKKWGQYLLRRP